MIATINTCGGGKSTRKISVNRLRTNVIDEWKSIGTNPVSVNSPGFTYKDDYLYFTSYNYTNSRRTWKLNVDTGEVIELGLLPNNAIMSTLVIVDNVIYCVSGQTSSYYSKQIYKLNESTNEWDTETEIPDNYTMRSGVTVYNNKIYIFGGYNFSAWSNQIRYYDLKTKEWTIISTILPRATNVMITPTCLDGFAYCKIENVLPFYKFEFETESFIEIPEAYYGYYSYGYMIIHGRKVCFRSGSFSGLSYDTSGIFYYDIDSEEIGHITMLNGPGSSYGQNMTSDNKESFFCFQSSSTAVQRFDMPHPLKKIYLQGDSNIHFDKNVEWNDSLIQSDTKYNTIGQGVLSFIEDDVSGVIIEDIKDFTLK